MPNGAITLSQLSKSVKGLVNKINGESVDINTKIGILSNLTTTTKSDIVTAINEVAANNNQNGVTSVNGATGAVVLNIPAAQVNSDWNATSGVAQILNKPTIPEDLFESGSGVESI